MYQMTEVMLSLLNDIAVGVFGVLLSASFGSDLRSRRNHIILSCCMLMILFFHWIAYSMWSVELCSRLYPLIVHIPTIALLYILTKKPLWSVIAVLCAYLFCEIRRWFALLAVVILHGGDHTQNVAELIFTLPLLIFLMRFASPAIRQVMDYPIKTQLQFGLIPAIYYIFDYVTRIYTDLLSGGSPVVLEFMPFVCCVAYLMFLLYNFSEERKRQQLRQIQSNLDFQLSQAVREITQLRESQAQTVRYRHDLRH
ncbi:MAG: histidine kinase, partial [Oscillospiraceae bacterium]|nr:histidine kinase [Oscillospiraceae bacterium]